ncbi:MAG: hypothetical protein EA339_12380 [Rhodobacteraceae bacterium]|nr:MAG: hypothetical protein EA339_12380 [Paracoccaceae bacterium]
MDFASIVPVLFMFTLLFVIVFALISKKAVQARAADPDVPKSTLAKDGPQGGVAFLNGHQEPKELVTAKR